MSLYVIPRGGFGNVLFTYLIGSALSKKYNMPLYFVKRPDKRRVMSTYRIFKDCTFVDMPSENIVWVKEPQYWYNPVQINGQKNNILDGYFQSFKYSQEYLAEIKRELFPAEPKLSQRPTVLLHVRRGDYLQLQDYHPVQNDDYYVRAIKIMQGRLKNPIFHVFSDDIDYMKNWDVLKGVDHEIIDVPDAEECFHHMIRCDGFIIANSSFSLLAYYFRDNEDAPVCAPKLWFGSKGPKYKMEDLIEMGEFVDVI